MTDTEVKFIAESIRSVLSHYHDWKTDYEFDTQTGEYRHKQYRDQYLNLADVKF
jgi:hypothetical protein